MIKRTFDPGFRIELHQKDLNLALQGAKALGVSLPNTADRPGAVQCLRRQRHERRWTIRRWCRAIELMANHQIAEG